VLEKVERMVWLLDFYGPLLTERQRRIMQLHYENDWSLGEIAGEMQVTRQAVHDILRRAEKSLEQYEDRLGLVEKFRLDRRRIAEAYGLLKELRTGYHEGKANRVLQLLEEVLATQGA